MSRAAIFWLFILLVPSPNASSQNSSITFSGEVSQGQSFQRSIGYGLVFMLEPLPQPQLGNLTGWTIKVSMQGQPPDPECADFAWVVTPPYRFGNHLNIDTQWGRLAQEAVRISPRGFRFVLNCADLKTEGQRVDRVLWPYSYPQKDAEESLARLGSSPLGEGRLWIKSYRITPGKKSDSETDVGAIHWIRFKVEIAFPRPRDSKYKP